VRYLRLGTRINLPDDFADAIFASHVWEHLYRDDAESITLECRRILKPGGILRLIVPDLKYFCERYIAGTTKSNAEELNAALLFHNKSEPIGFVRRALLAFGDLHTHKFMYDGPALVRLVTSCGFIDASERNYHDSLIPEIRQIESPERVLNGSGIIVECRKAGI